jgi:hypothetical protein
LANPLLLSYTPSLQTFYRTPKDDEQNPGEHGFAFRQNAFPKAQFRKNEISQTLLKLTSAL